MNDIEQSILIFVILAGVAWFVRRKAKQAGGFGKWLWQVVFGAVAAFLVYILFLQFVHYSNPILKHFMLFIVLSIVAPIAGWIGGLLYEGRR